MSGGSLRRRILLGAILWTLGLFIAAFVVSTIVLTRHREYAVLLHRASATHDGLALALVLLCMLGGLLLVRWALSPIAALRGRLAAVRAGTTRRIEGRYPTEIRPLVEDLNSLLDHQEQAVRRAVVRAGDLAHGLKTPLAVLAAEAERARAVGHDDLAETIGAQVQGMRRQVDYYLAQARAGASGATLGASCTVRESVDGLVRTLQRLHAARRVEFRVAVDPTHVVRAQRQDVDEMLGNLLDNACKWSRSRVLVTSAAEGMSIIIRVDDDGPGVPPALRGAVLQRGVRADEAAAGSGFGLAIVSDLAELYGGAISLSRAESGGLRACLRLPAVPPT